jgi:hypothetical protein
MSRAIPLHHSGPLVACYRVTFTSAPFIHTLTNSRTHFRIPCHCPMLADWRSLARCRSTTHTHWPTRMLGCSQHASVRQWPYFIPQRTELNPICNWGNRGSSQSVYTQLWHRITFCIDSVLKHCAANRKRLLSALPNPSPYIHDVKISGFTKSSTYIRH